MPAKSLIIGITGHRPNRLAARDVVAADIAKLLDGLGAAARQNGCDTEMISALAEGTDRIGAEAALCRGWPLHVVLPFSRAEYERDFGNPSSLAEFAELLDRASDVTVLPGKSDHRDEAYEKASQWMLVRTDILIAIWDGAPSAGRGGTRETMDAAIARNMAIIRIDATGQRCPSLYGPNVPQTVPGAIAAAAIEWPARQSVR